MDVIHAEQLARSLMHQHNLADWSFHFNRRRALGLCRYAQKRIELTFPYHFRNNDPSRTHLLHTPTAGIPAPIPP